MSKLPYIAPSDPPKKPLMPCPTSPMQQSEYESYNTDRGNRDRRYPWDENDSIVNRVIGED